MTDQSRPQDQDQEVVQVAESSGRGRCKLHQTNSHGKILLFLVFLLFHFQLILQILTETEARGPRNRPRSHGLTDEAD